MEDLSKIDTKLASPFTILITVLISVMLLVVCSSFVLAAPIDPCSYIQETYSSYQLIPNYFYTQYGKITGADSVNNGTQYILLYDNGVGLLYDETTIPTNSTSDHTLIDFGVSGSTGIAEIPSDYYDGAKFAVSDSSTIYFFDVNASYLGFQSIAATIQNLAYDPEWNRLIVSTTANVIMLTKDRSISTLFSYPEPSVQFLDMESSPVTYEFLQRGQFFTPYESTGGLRGFSCSIGTDLAQGFDAYATAHTNSHTIMVSDYSSFNRDIFIYPKLDFQSHTETISHTPLISLLSPQNNEDQTSNESIKTVNFLYNVNSSTVTVNYDCTLFIKDLITANDISLTLTSIQNNVLQNITQNISNGNYTWNVSCDDNYGRKGASELRTFFVTTAQAQPDSPPILTHINNQIIMLNQQLLIQLNATDIDSSNLTYATNAQTILPSISQFNQSSGLFTWTPISQSDIGDYNITFNVTDGQFSDEISLQITVIQTSWQNTTLTEQNWTMFEEIVGGNPCYSDGIGSVEWSYEPVSNDSSSLLVWANKNQTSFSNHVIAQNKLANVGRNGSWIYETYAYIAPQTNATGQTGPEFSIQNTRNISGNFKTATAGIQYIANPYLPQTWRIWTEVSPGVADWVDMFDLSLESGNWYHLILEADYDNNIYVSLSIKGDIIDETYDLTDYKITLENKFSEEAVWLTLESENMWNNFCGVSGSYDYKVYYDNTRLTNTTTKYVPECTTNSQCSDGLYCNGAELCVANKCQNVTPIDCSANDVVSINSCLNNPDNNAFTLDIFAGFTSVCNEVAESCSSGTTDITSSCNIASCGAECEINNDCANKCVGDDYYSSGSCQASCSCNYVTTNCNIQDGWYNTSTTQTISLSDCTEMIQLQQEYHEYTCVIGGCNYSITSTQWINTTIQNKIDGTICDDNLYCTINDQCTAGVCGSVTSKDCSANNLAAIDSCTNIPDNNAFTKDIFAGFTSVCNEVADSCSSGTTDITSSCNIASCGAQCESNDDCNDANASTIDTCNSCVCEHTLVFECSNECTALGTNQCSANNLQTCGNYDADPCLEWNTGDVCQYGCSNGACLISVGSIYASSSPTGASVYIDDVLMGVTPITISNVEVGTRQVKFTKSGYNDKIVFVTVVKDIKINVVATLTVLPPGKIYATSTPTSSYVYVDNVYKGLTPVTISRIASGTHQVKFKKSGHADIIISVNVSSGETSSVSATLLTLGKIYATSTPTRAYVYVDNVYKGLTPVTISRIASGTHQVKFKKDGYSDTFISVNVSLGETSSVFATLSAFGKISATSIPTGAKVYVDNVYKGLTPVTISRIASGTHQVKFKKYGYSDTVVLVNVSSGETASVSAILPVLGRV